jgi:cobalt-zinc-cadmium efflux system protein
MPIDPLLSIAVSLLILRSAWVLVRKSGHILLEGTPEWLDIERLRAELKDAVPAVEDIHHVHAWSLTSRRPLLTLHANVCEGADHDEVLASIKRFLEIKFRIDHSTIQLEPGACADERPDRCSEPEAR